MAHTVHYPPGHWTIAPPYDGLIDSALVTGDAQYLALVIWAGLRTDYGVGERIVLSQVTAGLAEILDELLATETADGNGRNFYSLPNPERFTD